MPTLVDSCGNPVSLGKELGRGGEGSVYEVGSSTHGGHVAKLYHKPVERELAAKLATMTAIQTDRLVRLAAWPTTILHDQHSHGLVRGFLMPRATGKPAHLLYSPKSRQTEFPRAGWKFLVRSATNAARAVATIHDHGHVIGDINQNTFFVSEQATITLINCDSFQITAQGHYFFCEVGVDTFTPPELQGKSFKGIARTTNHDSFGLAVLIFHLLFMGRHPFSGRYLGPETKPLEKLIAEGRFAYGPNAGIRQMAPPPSSLPLQAVTPPIATLFERAFGSNSSRFGARPTPHEWVDALSELEKQLFTCSNNRAHQIPHGLVTCPWCTIESKSGVALFGAFATFNTPKRTPFDLAAIWTTIAAIPPPGAMPCPAPANAVVQPQPEFIEAGKRRRRMMLMTFGIGLLFGAAKDEHNRAVSAVEAAKNEYGRLVARWNEEASGERFHVKMVELSDARQRHLDLDAERQRRLKALRDNARDRQLRKHLESYFIRAASIRGIGPAKTATLQSFGIETAADVIWNDVIAVPGFGPTTAQNLMQWRKLVEAKFTFNPMKAVDPADIARVEQEIAAKQARAEQELKIGPKALEQIKQETLQRRIALQPVLERAAAQLAQAEANLRAL